MPMLPIYAPIRTIESLGQLVTMAAEASSGHPSSARWFRGQRNTAWSLQSALWRRIEDDNGRLKNEPYTHADERNFTHRFRVRAAIRRPEAPSYDDSAGWLSLMQHYGLPTRLLDWSRSPLVAAYFAVAETASSIGAPTDAAIWMLNPHRLNKVMTGHSKTPALKSGDVSHLVRDAFFDNRELEGGQIRRARPGDRAKVMAAMAWEADQRMVVQQGAFTVHAAPSAGGRAGLPGLEAHESASEYLELLRIPAGKIGRFTGEVAAAVLREGDLFPDLEHLARELKSTYPAQTIHSVKT